MEIIEEKQETVKKVRRFCDECGEELHWSLGCQKTKCETCGKLLCSKCIGHESPMYGDYRTVYCRSCSSVYNKYKPEVNKLSKQLRDLHNNYVEEARSKRNDFKP